MSSKQGSKGSFLSHLWKKNNEEKPKVHKIHKGLKNDSYFDKEKGKWIFPGEEEEEKVTTLPPPKSLSKVDRKTKTADRSKLSKNRLYATGFNQNQLHNSIVLNQEAQKPKNNPKAYFMPPPGGFQVYSHTEPVQNPIAADNKDGGDDYAYDDDNDDDDNVNVEDQEASKDVFLNKQNDQTDNYLHPKPEDQDDVKSEVISEEEDDQENLGNQFQSNQQQIDQESNQTVQMNFDEEPNQNVDYSQDQQISNNQLQKNQQQQHNEKNSHEVDDDQQFLPERMLNRGQRRHSSRFTLNSSPITPQRFHNRQDNNNLRQQQQQQQQQHQQQQQNQQDQQLQQNQDINFQQQNIPIQTNASLPDQSPEQVFNSNICANFLTTNNTSFYDQQLPDQGQLQRILEQRFNIERQDIIEQFMKEREQLQFDKNERIQDLEGEIRNLQEEMDLQVKSRVNCQMNEKKLQAQVQRSSTQNQKLRNRNKKLIKQLEQLRKKVEIQQVSIDMQNTSFNNFQTIASSDQYVSQSQLLTSNTILQNQESQKQILNLLSQRNEFIQQIQSLKQANRILNQTKDEQLEQMKNFHSIELDESQYKSDQAMKKLKVKLEKSLDKEVKRNARLNNEITTLRQKENESNKQFLIKEKELMARIHEQNDSLAKLEGLLNDSKDQLNTLSKQSRQQKDNLQRANQDAIDKILSDSQAKSDKVSKEFDKVKNFSSHLQEKLTKSADELKKNYQNSRIIQQQNQELKRQITKLSNIPPPQSEVYVIQQNDSHMKAFVDLLTTRLRDSNQQKAVRFQYLIYQQQRFQKQKDHMVEIYDSVSEERKRIISCLESGLDLQNRSENLDQLAIYVLRSYSNLRKEIINQKNDNKQLQHVNRQQEVDINQINKKLQFNVIKLQLYKNAFQNLKNQYIKLQRKSDKQSIEILKQQQTIDQQNQEIFKLRSMNQQNVRLSQSRLGELLQLNEEYKSLQVKILQKNKQISEITKNSSSSNDQILSLQLEVKNLEKINKQLVQNMRQSENMSVQRYQEMQNEVQGQKQKNVKLQQVINDMKNRQRELQQNFKKQNARDKQTWQNQAKKAILKLKERISTTKQKLQASSSQNQIMKKQMTLNQTDISSLQQSIISKSKQLSNLEKDKNAQIVVLTSKLNKLTKIKQELERQKDKMVQDTQSKQQEQIDQFQKDKDEKIDKIRQLSEENQNLKLNYQDIKSRFQDLEIQLQEQKSKAVQNQNKLENQNQKNILREQSKYTELNQKYIDSMERVQSLQNNEKDLRLEKEKVQGLNGSLKDQVDDKQREIDIIQEALKRVGEENKKYKAVVQQSDLAKSVIQLQELVANLNAENTSIKMLIHSQQQQSIEGEDQIKLESKQENKVQDDQNKEQVQKEEQSKTEQSGGLISSFASLFRSKTDNKN